MHLARRDRGLTLMELLTACAIVAILVAVAVPSLTAWRQSASLISVQRDIMAALYIGRSSAIAANAPRVVVITPPCKIDITDGAGRTTYYTRDLSAYARTVSVVGSSPVTITFDARGLLISSASVTLTLTDQMRRTKSITVYPTGKLEAG